VEEKEKRRKDGLSGSGSARVLSSASFYCSLPIDGHTQKKLDTA
jgi:hypothetical protein